MLRKLPTYLEIEWHQLLLSNIRRSQLFRIWSQTFSKK